MGSTEAVALRRLLDVTLALAAERRTEPVLRVILDAARDLAGARYAALGVPDGAGGYSLFLTAGVDAETWARIGALPRTHGLLGALLDCPTPIRLDDIRSDPRFRGWPSAHPDMRSFLGVPIVAGGEVLAELFLAERVGGPFTDSDQQLIETLSAHAALAVVNAQRMERARELSVAEERARLARELHDSVTQTLFSLTLAAESAAALAGPGPAGGVGGPGAGGVGGPGAGGSVAGPAGGPGGAAGAPGALAEQLDRVRELARTGLAEMRSMVETLRPVDPGADGLAGALRKRVDLLRRVHDVRLSLRLHGPARLKDRTVEREVLMVASEALANALQHAGAASIEVGLDTGGDAVRLTVADDGAGFDLARTLRESRRLGLTSMRERAEALGGGVRVDTAPGAGTTITLVVPGAC